MEEIWKTHPKFDERYEFSNFGNLRNTKTNINLKLSVDSSLGVIKTFIKSRQHKNRKAAVIHRIVAELFVDNQKPKTNKIVKHKDNNVLNNHYSNLYWVTPKESVNKDIAVGYRNYSSAQKMSVENVIKVRELFDSTDINLHDLTKQFDISASNLLAILKYTTFSQVQPEKKDTYKINNLSDNDLWVKNKRSRFNMKTKPERKSCKILPKEVFLPILDDYINSGLRYDALIKKHKALNKQHKITRAKLDKNLTLYPIPSVRLLEGEEFIPCGPNFVSNLGRRMCNGRIINMKPNNVVAKIIATKFVDNPNNYTNIIYKDKDKNNLRADNLEWINFVSNTFPSTIVIIDNAQDIINEYINTTVTYKDLAKKYDITLASLNRLLTGCKKTIQCWVCGEKDLNKFVLNNNTKRCDKCIESNPKKYSNLSDSDKKVKIRQFRQWAKNNLLRVKILQARSRAFKKNIDFDINEEFLIEIFNKQNGKCYYSGLSISLDSNNADEVISIDRIESDKGYTKDNVCLVRPIVNSMKLDLSVDEFFFYIENLYKNMFTHPMLDNYFLPQNLEKKIFEKGGTS